MTYIELINNFWELDEDWQFSCCETRLYFYLLKTANRLGWGNSWTRSDAKVSSDVGVSVNSMKTARNRLVQAGLVEFKPGGNGQRDKTRYTVRCQFRCQILIPKHEPNLIPNHEPKHEPKPQPYINNNINISKTKTKTKNINIPPSPPKGEIPKSEISIDFQNLVDLFNAKFEGILSRVTLITDKRKAAIRARIANHGNESVVKVFDLVLNSPFLLGENNRNWRADFDWIFKPSNFVKILEGNYLKRESNEACKYTDSAKSREQQTDREIMEYARSAFRKDIRSGS